ncbi:MAG: ATP-dependent helicase [Desulfovibrio sp.]|jgi:DNA helicase-2/ATP-dependent DNA helicase PcrA|nr:ATP-dependent helicase [Desulfovibrio sp.]
MIDYARDLNPAQLEAATTLEGPVLVIAGAGSGKTRTIVYRLARLVESGVPASSILLLTFTRKAAQEMLDRARRLMHQRGMPELAEYGPGANGPSHAWLAAVQGGTFHAYAYSVLRLFQPEGYGRNLTVMDSADIMAALQHCREELKAGKGDRSFPKNQTINGLLSKSRNKELPLEDVVRREASHLFMHVETMQRMAESYTRYKREKNLLDYDDLLFALEEALVTRPEALAYCRKRHRYIMVDEYQDTNPVQARIAGLVAGLAPDATRSPLPRTASGADAASVPPFTGNIMVVGDDAQSIYAFRGADVRNILRFPDLYPGTRLIRLEENYRSTQPLLDLSNAVLTNAAEGYAKHLFTRREGSAKPALIRPLSDRSQAQLAAARIVELLRVYRPGEIAVLFRAGFHSFALELALNKIGVAFRKFGGIRYTEAAHVKDVMSFVRLVLNALDHTAFTRMAALSAGVGPKTCLKIYRLIAGGNAKELKKALVRHAQLAEDLGFIERMRQERPKPALLLSNIVEHYRPRLESLFPDDYPRRMQGLEQLIQIASAYTELDLLVADLSLEDPAGGEEEYGDAVVLSTVHSAKGLEWAAVLIIDLVEERFPSRHAMARPEDFEEERRLMYVACTRAKDSLTLYVPATMYDRGSGGNIPGLPSPFVRELTPGLYDEWQEGYHGGLVEKKRETSLNPFARASTRTTEGSDPFVATKSAAPVFAARTRPGSTPEAPLEEQLPANGIGQGERRLASPGECGFCRHRIFGRGKIVQHLPPDKVRVNFPGVGLKVIMAAYLTMED